MENFSLYLFPPPHLFHFPLALILATPFQTAMKTLAKIITFRNFVCEMVARLPACPHTEKKKMVR